MVVVLGTLGFRPETLIPTIRSTKSLDKVVVFHSDHERSRGAATEVSALCEAMSVKFVDREIPNAYDFIMVARA
ncbi:MAG: hypothetical protein N3G75_09430, partial [Methanothrix sp.]